VTRVVIAAMIGRRRRRRFGLGEGFRRCGTTAEQRSHGQTNLSVRRI